MTIRDNTRARKTYSFFRQPPVYASGGGGGGGSICCGDPDAEYLVLFATGSLNAERVFTPGTGLTATDGGAGANYTLAIVDSVVATISGSTFSGVTKHSAGLSGSLTQLTDGTSYLIAGSGIQITSQSNGSITITSTGGGGSSAYFDSTTSGAIYATGSLALRGNETGIDSPFDKGSDIFFYVSGSLDGNNKSVFGGDVVVSGSLKIKNGELTSDSATSFNLLNDVTTTLTFADNVNTLNVGNNSLSTVSLGSNAPTVNVGDGAIGGTVIIGCFNGGTTLVKSSETILSGNVTLGDSSNDTITFSGSVDSNVLPLSDFTYTLGTPNKRWQHVYTGDLHLRNDKGDWTIVEERDYLCVVNNITGKKYKMMLQPLDND